MKRQKNIFTTSSIFIISIDFVMYNFEMHGTYLRFLVSSSSANVVVFLVPDLSASLFFLSRSSSSFA